MADNRMNEVRGPTSALTSFLRSKNIRVQNTNRFRRRDQAAAAAQDEEVPAGTASPSASPARATPVATPEPAARSRRPAAARRPMGASMSFVEEEDDDTDDGNLADVSTASALDQGEGSSNGASSRAAARSARTLGQASYRNTAAGSVDFCAMCSKRFTVTAYTTHTPAGGLCHKCGGQSKGGKIPSIDFPETATSIPEPPKKKVRRKPQQQELRSIPSLQELCINIVANYIEDVEALMGVGGQNMDMISKSISKNRRLNSSTMLLFLQPGAKHLAFYDCSQIGGEALASIPKFCPALHTINLQLCGMLDNDALDSWGEKLPDLERVELYGPFLVRVEAWHRFFERVGARLKSFKIRESPRFDRECCEKMLAYCPNIEEIGLAQIGKLNADCLAIIKQYGQQLTYLDISDPGVSAPGVPPQSLKDDEVIDLLQQVGPRLSHLDVSRNADLTGRTLLEGIRDNCISLRSLHTTLLHSEAMTPEDFVALFEGLNARGGAKLTHLSLERCLAVNDDVIRALVAFCGRSLEDLSLNSCDGITEDGMRMVGEGCPNLHKLDVSFCRSVTDALVMDFAAGMPRLKEVWLFSCNKITPSLRSDRIRLIGKEKYSHI